jgi:hypothetical protein
VVAEPMRERQDGQRRIGPARGGEHRAAGNVEVGIPCTRQSRSTTPCSGRSLIRVVPM